MKKKKIIIILIILMLISIINNNFARDLLVSYNNYYIKQLLWFIIGFLLIYVISKLNLDFIFKYSFYLYLFGNFLLLLTLLVGKNINGSRAWLGIGFFSIQPSEFMKVFIILYLKEFTNNNNYSAFKYILLSLLIVMVPSILTFLEPDTGAVIFNLIIWITFLFLKKINKWYFIGTFSIVLLFGVSFLILYYKYPDTFINFFGTSFFYRMDRLTSFINGDGYQIKEALKSTSNAGLYGLKDKHYFPESATDFALTLLISNFGIIGLIVFLVIYTLFINELLKYKKDKYILYPLIFILLFQYIVNILMNVGLFPIIGITLPFLSYGGSSLISYMILIGFLLKEN